MLPRSAWKFALHRVGTGYRDIHTVLSPTQADGSASQGLGIAELASAFAALDALTDVSEDKGLTADDVVACVDKQRAMLLSLASTSLLESQEALIGGIDE